ncbi:Protein-tyrosine sulfotransferase [Sarcoptes scabiei]|uniref:Protein-tyrosine sulfotransferase n=1 Tax=Sarcoptes scabiei TaxID=52283 RepID=A0A834R8Z7_SARSC|nr:Protein-tyrosine sulfotransferase [Sarcoptes scabiei]
MLVYFRRYPFYIFLFFQLILILVYYTSKKSDCLSRVDFQINDNQLNIDDEWVQSKKYLIEGRTRYPYDHLMPLIFIGGMPRSGTTLLRVLLDAHPDIRCGEETRVIPRILSNRQSWLKAPFESKRLEEAGITTDVLDSAIRSFILEIIVRHGKRASRLCNKDPFTIRSATYLQYLFPNSKFIFMIRDGRAVVHSIISRKVTISGFDLKDYRDCLIKWNTAMTHMNEQCNKLGPNICLPVHYEQLVLNPTKSMHRILDFLNLPWNDTVLHHEKLVEMGDISLSKLERSTDQVIKPINLEALSKWVGHIPDDVIDEMPRIAPMLQKLGYDPRANPPNYGEPDSFVQEKMNELDRNKQKWDQKQLHAQKVRDNLRQNIMNSTAHKRSGSRSI